MTPTSFRALGLIGSAYLVSTTLAKLPATLKHGTNLGGWLVSEPWMNPVEWQRMGGQPCPTTGTCNESEWALTRQLGQKRANEVFLQHYQSWFTQEHVKQLRHLGLDHVRIPIGFWICPELVEAPAEAYPQGGWLELKRGLRQLNRAGFHVLIDMHAMPGVAAENQMFAGNVTTEVHFYEEHNYHRALVWSAILTVMTHFDPDFQSVVGIECINEPLQDASLTPGLDQYYSDFVTVTRVIEYALGVPCETDLSVVLTRLTKSKGALSALVAAIPLIRKRADQTHVKVSLVPLLVILRKHLQPGSAQLATIETAISPSTQVAKRHTSISHNNRLKHRSVARPLTEKHDSPEGYASKGPQPTSRSSTAKSCIATMAMPKRWQYKGPAYSLQPYALGPAAYDDHMYYSFGGVANATFESYMSTMCNQQHYELAKQSGEVPYGHGEFSIATNFNTTKAQFRAWGDAQRFMYNKENFWTFWSFRLGTPDPTYLKPEFIQMWSYIGAVEAGLWPKDPKQYFNPSVCKPYFNSASSAINPSDSSIKVQ